MNELIAKNDYIANNEPLTPADLKHQVQLIQQVMSDVMREDEHFGKIPGCGDKPTLLKPGAEKLSFLFQLRPSFDIERIEYPDQHREYIITCTLTNRGGVEMGQGVGSCSTLESKYKYRVISKATSVPVPKGYWTDRDNSILKGAFAKAGKESKHKLGTTKDDNGKWVIGIKGRSENPDIPDVWNTVLKIAKKRAHVDAVLNVTAASDIFTQDLEDISHTVESKPEKRTKKDVKKPSQKATVETEPVAVGVRGQNIDDGPMHDGDLTF